MTRLSSLSRTVLHSRINYTARQISTIRRQIPHAGLTTRLSAMSTIIQSNGYAGPSRVMKTTTRDLSRELEDGIKAWDGPSVFSTIPSSPLPRAQPREKGHGTSSSPIDISSAEPSPIVTRVRGVAKYNSPLPRTAFTSPSKPPSLAPGQVHPFFNRTKSLPPPASNRPRLVAHYSSTESSSQQTETGDSQSTFEGPSESSSHEPVRTAEAPPQPPIKERSAKGVTRQVGDKGKGKERETIHDAGFSDEAIDAMANEFANVEIGRRSGKTGSGIMVSAPTYVKSRPATTVPVPNHTKSTASATSKPTAGPSTLRLKAAIPSTSLPAKPRVKKPMELDHPDTVYFQYQRCPNPPAVVYTTDPSEANDLISCLKGDVFGFDLEWPSGIKTWDPVNKKYTFPQGKTALVQICDHHTIILIHLKGTAGLPEKVIELVQDPTKFKLGVQIGGDGSKLLRDFRPALTRAVSLLELSKLARTVDAQFLGPGNMLIALAKLTKRYTGYPLRKETHVRAGNWAGDLDQTQRDYAANDVYASLLVYDKLMALSQEREIEVDRRGLCSHHGDLKDLPRPISPNGEVVPHIAGQNGSLSPTPAQSRTITMFIEGKSTETIAIEMGVKRTTAQSHLAAGIGRVDEDILSEVDKRRFLEDVKDNFWVKRDSASVLTQIRAELNEIDGLSVNQPTVVGDDEDTEVEEEIEEVKN